MKTQLALLALTTLCLSNAALAGSDTVACKSKTGLIAFDVGNGSNTISIKMKDKKSGKVSTYTAPAKLMPFYDYNTEETDKTLSVLPVSPAKLLKSDNTIQVIHDKNGKVKCSGREFTHEIYSQTVLITAKQYNRENQGLDSQLIAGKIVPGLNAETSFITVPVVCQHDQVTTAGGCYADDDDIITVVPDKN